MNIFTSACRFAACATLLALPTMAQQDRNNPNNPQTPRNQQDPNAPRATEPAQAAPKDRMFALDELMGAEVLLQASYEDKQDAAEDGEVAKRPAATIENIIVDMDDGSFRWVVLSVGGLLGIGDKHVAIPCSAFTPRHEVDDDGKVTPRFVLNATEAELKSLADFDADQVEEQGIVSVVRTVEASWATLGRTVDPDGKRGMTGQAAGDRSREAADSVNNTERRAAEASGDTVRGTTEQPVVRSTTVTAISAVPMVLASEIDEFPVHANTEEIGSVSKVIANEAGICCLVVASGGVLGLGESQTIVPLQAANLVSHEDGYAWRVNKTKDELKNSGVKYSEPENCPGDHAALQRAENFFGVRKDDKKAEKHRDGMQTDKQQHGDKKQHDGNKKPDNSKQ